MCQAKSLAEQVDLKKGTEFHKWEAIMKKAVSHELFSIIACKTKPLKILVEDT